MKIKHFLQLIIMCLSLFSYSASAKVPSPAEAKVWAEEKGNMLLQTFQEKNLAQKYKTLDNLFLQYIDLEYIGQFVMGKYWRVMTPEQRQTYQQLFRRYALSVYKSFPLTFRYPITFSINNAIASSNYTEVFATIDLDKNFQTENDPQNTNQKINVVFKLISDKNTIKIIDLTVAESSLILSYRNRFYQMVADADEDMDWFLEDLEMIVNSTEKTNQQKLEETRQ